MIRVDRDKNQSRLCPEAGKVKVDLFLGFDLQINKTKNPSISQLLIRVEFRTFTYTYLGEYIPFIWKVYFKINYYTED